MSEEKTPKRGDLAFCSLGCLGVITCDEPQEITYADGNKGYAWTGIHLCYFTWASTKPVNIKPGDPWSSRNPKVVANTEFLQLFLKKI